MNLDAPISAKPKNSLFSVKMQTASEGEWLQEATEDAHPGAADASEDATGRFNWRGRAASRMKTELKTDGVLPRFKKRIRPLATGHPGADPVAPAIQRYTEKFLKLLALEEAEDEAALKHRLSTWSVDQLMREGYCITGMSAYWLEANQFGRPVASFVMGPGIKLPENKFENGSQVLVSRLDPLKEDHVAGSVLSRTQSQIRVCFANHFDLDDGLWRLDLGRPNLMYERMRQAIGHFEHDPERIQKQVPEDPSHQYILHGTQLRDVILRSYISPPQEEQQEGVVDLETIDALANSSAENTKLGVSPLAQNGIFGNDQRIHSWARRYSQPNPIVMEGDPPLDGLNASQKRAMAAMIGERISLIQGPPGTGKTKTIIETIKLLKVHFEVPQPILVCTYTNVAVDNLVEGFANVGVKPLRVGYHGHVRESLLNHSLDYKLQEHHLHDKLSTLVAEEALMQPKIEELTAKCSVLEAKIQKSSRPRKDTLRRMSNMQTALVKLELRHKYLKGRIYATQQHMLRDVMAQADVICTTCITAACNALNVVDSPVVFIDEASMSTEPASLIPLMKGSQHVALIGDHKQLPPVIVSKQAKEEGFGISLFERLTEEGHVPSVMLDIQYRMHPAISRFPAKEFYNLALLDGTVDAGGNALPGLEPPSSKHTRHHGEKHRPSVIFLDHTGNESYKGKSLVNINEAHIVASIVEDLLLNNPLLQGDDIGIIAPYAAQIKLLSRLFNTDATYRKRFQAVLGDLRAMQLEHIEIKTVDGFEGREKQVIIFSTVRNNPSGYIGFLADKKRLNVGLTRAKRGLFVVGSISTLRAGRQTSSQDEQAVVKVSKGADSWRRYAEFLTEGNLVVRLTGDTLERALYEHLETARRRLGDESRLLKTFRS
ncbi:P-loop containing nucleoside triphosphate hydrolase protein [Flammula alnicola]|nr:P-loop containing nucleoside triphosphate hydrolase protein [Flammula alnicola]